MKQPEPYEMQDRMTMKNIKILVACLLGVTAGLIVAAMIIG